MLTPVIAVRVLTAPIYQDAEDLPRQVAAAKAEGLPLSPEELSSHHAPELDSLPLYQRVFEAKEARDSTEFYAALKSKKALRSYVGNISKLLEAVDAASRKPFLDLPVRLYAPAGGVGIGDIAFFGRVALLSARYSAEEGDFNSALKFVDLANRIASHLSQQPDDFADSRMRDLHFQISAELLRILHLSGEREEVLQHIESLQFAKAIPLAELIKGWSATVWLRLDEQVEMAFGDAAEIDGTDSFARSETRKSFPFYCDRKIEINAYRARLTRLLRTVLGIARSPRPEADRVKLIDREISKENDTIVGSLVMDREFLTKLRVEGEMLRHVFRATLSLIKAHTSQGKYPATLASSDPVIKASLASGELVYRRTPTGFQLYLVGLNGRDDGGPDRIPRNDDKGFNYPPLQKMKP